jgi:hypothetical protein
MCLYYQKKYIWIIEYNIFTYTMRLNVINNYKTIYYNFLASFYLCLNSILPYYDDVIISIQSQAIKLLIDNNTLNMKKIKKIRMIEFIDTLDKSDKIILDKEKDIILVDYSIYKSDSSQNISGQDEDDDQDQDTETDTCAAYTAHSATNNVDTTDTTDTSENSDPEKDPYEPCKKKSRIDNDYISRPVEPAQLTKDKDDYYNIGIYTAASAVSAAAAAVANNAAKYLIEDSEGNTTDSTEAADAVDDADTTEAAVAADAADIKEGYGYDLDNEIDESFRNIIQNIVYDKKKDD